MKAKRFTGATSREVMQQVREALGPDAVILANNAIVGGIEILALSNRDMEGFIAAGESQAMPSKAETPAALPVRPAASPMPSRAALPAAVPPGQNAALTAKKAQASFRDFLSRGAANGAALPAVAKRGEEPSQQVTFEGERAEQSQSDLLAEIKEMKGLLTQQFESLALTESMRRRPLRGILFRELLAAGFRSSLARGITERLPDDFSEQQSRRWLQEVLTKNLSVQNGSDIVDQGGVYALVGPTGVGKTTTAAKLAARCVMKHGAQGLGLITTDNYRIGAHDQLRIYGKILGVPVFVAQDTAELEHAIAAYAGKHLVLIDTVGMGQRDARIAEQHALLKVPSIRRLLLLNATCQSETLDDVVRSYAGTGGAASLHGTILTKIDETIKLGGVLDVVLRNRLRLHFVSNGQRVPEDLHLPNAKLLVHRAMKTSESATDRADSTGVAMALGVLGNTAGHAHA
jgi:flagellar biosynthesis protein FlhF